MGIDDHELAFLALVFTVFIVTNALNFTLVVGSRTLADGFSLRDAFRTLFLPVLPSQLAAALLTGVIAVIYNQVGFVALALLGGVLVIFQYLLRELLRSRDRAEELQRRSTQLASLQMGVLAVMVQTLSLRDHMTARHSAAVARYARELARALGCSEAEQDLVHTAGLLHDIGKFIFPDDILFAERPLTEDDWRCVRRHPTQGSLVVRQVDGYGPVADLVLCHHEHYDGSGYPRGLAGREIPRLARVLAVADTYDVITARDSYQQPRHPIQAIAELRAVSGTQLDPEAVEAFVALLESRGVAFQHGDDADFEAELAFSARVRAYAEPRPEVPVAS